MSRESSSGECILHHTHSWYTIWSVCTPLDICLDVMSLTIVASNFFFLPCVVSYHESLAYETWFRLLEKANHQHHHIPYAVLLRSRACTQTHRLCILALVILPEVHKQEKEGKNSNSFNITNISSHGSSHFNPMSHFCCENVLISAYSLGINYHCAADHLNMGSLISGHLLMLCHGHCSVWWFTGFLGEKSVGWICWTVPKFVTWGNSPSREWKKCTPPAMGEDLLQPFRSKTWAIIVTK